MQSVLLESSLGPIMPEKTLRDGHLESKSCDTRNLKLQFYWMKRSSIQVMLRNKLHFFSWNILTCVCSCPEIGPPARLDSKNVWRHLLSLLTCIRVTHLGSFYYTFSFCTRVWLYPLGKQWWFSKCALRTTASASPGLLLEMQISNYSSGAHTSVHIKIAGRVC